MNIKDLSMEELKALAYERMKLMQQAQNDLNTLEGEMRSREQNNIKEKKDGKNKKGK